MPDTNDNNSSTSSSNILLSHLHTLEQAWRATSEWQLQKIKSEILPCRRLRLLNSFPAAAAVAVAAFSGSLAAVAAQSTFDDVAVDCAQCSAENTLHTVKTTTQSVPRQEQHLCVYVCVCAAFAVVVLSCCVFRFPYRVCMPHGPTTVQRTCCGFIERACDLCMKSEKDNEQQQQQLRQQRRLRQ